MTDLPSKPYIDDEGVLRGYYVYAHRSRGGGAVFYVGKGVGKRAWERKSRNPDWHAAVEALDGEFDVDILAHDLTEAEAYELEERLVEEHGGAEGESLTNRVAGGEPGLSVGFALEVPEVLQESFAAYDAARSFRALPRDVQLSLATPIAERIDAWINHLDELQQQADETGDEALEDSVFHLDTILGSFGDRIKDLRKRRLSWHDFCLELEEVVDDLDDDELREGCHAGTQPIHEEALRLLRERLSSVDSGNRDEAEAAARRMREANGPDDE